MSFVLNGDYSRLWLYLLSERVLTKFLCIVFPVKPNIPVYRAKFSEITPQWVFTVTDFLHFSLFCLVCAYFALALALVMFLTVYLSDSMGLLKGFWHCQYCHLIVSSQNVWGWNKYGVMVTMSVYICIYICSPKQQWRVYICSPEQ